MNLYLIKRYDLRLEIKADKYINIGGMQKYANMQPEGTAGLL